MIPLRRTLSCAGGSGSLRRNRRISSSAQAGTSSSPSPAPTSIEETYLFENCLEEEQQLVGQCQTKLGVDLGQGSRASSHHVEIGVGMLLEPKG